MSMKQFIEDQNAENFKNPSQSRFYRFQQKITEDNFDLIDIGQVNYDKKIALIYNPASGKKSDKREQITEALDKLGIQHEYLLTYKRWDAVNLCRELDLSKYSAIVAVGGDGTIHEVVNGIMTRKDGKKLPIGFLPNGTGNDMCGAIELDNVEQGLQYLAKGNTIQVDVLEATLDFESADDVRKHARENPEFDISKSLRYCVINTQMLISGLTAKNAAPMKPYLGSLAYTISCFRELYRKYQCTLDIEIDEGRHVIRNLTTQYLQIYNGKFGGGRIMLNPLGMINDGYMELCYRPDLVTTAFGVWMFIQPGGKHFYDPGFQTYRCSTVKLINRNKTRGEVAEDINIDGEDLTFKDFVKYRVKPSCIEIIVDFDEIYNKTYKQHV